MEHGRRLVWVGAVGLFLCLASVVTLTLLLPSGEHFRPDGGYLPLSNPVAAPR